MKLQITIKVNRVFWDTDGASYKSCGLPASLKGSTLVWDVEGDTEANCDEAAFDLTSDWLSDQFGYCHRGFQGRVDTRTPLPDDAKTDNGDTYIDSFGNEGEGNAARADLAR